MFNYACSGSFKTIQFQYDLYDNKARRDTENRFKIY